MQIAHLTNFDFTPCMRRTKGLSLCHHSIVKKAKHNINSFKPYKADGSKNVFVQMDCKNPEA